MSKFPKCICATQEKTSRKEGKKTGLKMRQPKGGWNDNLSLAYQKYILNHLALLPEPKLEKVKNTSEIEYIYLLKYNNHWIHTICTDHSCNSIYYSKGWNYRAETTSELEKGLGGWGKIWERTRWPGENEKTDGTGVVEKDENKTMECLLWLNRRVFEKILIDWLFWARQEFGN